MLFIDSLRLVLFFQCIQSDFKLISQLKLNSFLQIYRFFFYLECFGLFFFFKETIYGSYFQSAVNCSIDLFSWFFYRKRWSVYFGSWPFQSVLKEWTSLFSVQTQKYAALTETCFLVDSAELYGTASKKRL